MAYWQTRTSVGMTLHGYFKVKIFTIVYMLDSPLLHQEESRSISENVNLGQRKRFADGKVSLPYGQFLGYEKGEDGLPKIVELEAVTVRLIYRLFLEGKTPSGIAKHLTTNGIPTPSGKQKWQASTVESILSNEKYKGDICFQKSYVLDTISHKKKKNKGNLPCYHVSGTHPYIIEPELWECAQLEIHRRRNYARKHHTRINSCTDGLPMLGRVICRECGSSFATRSHSEYLFCTAYEKSDAAGREKLNCHQIKIDKLMPERIFISAWNYIVNECEKYMPEWQQIIEGNDTLKAYRTKELVRLITEIGHIETMPYELMLKTLDHIEIGPDGMAEVIFLTGTKVNVDN